ncbi:MAG: methylmalonyl Co-A mutase-associated GTPase MeaB [Fimbriimonas sp.]|nr:methylmalonyl Co-A mutase-associated GTPase MeaB [Fimbriimonas sp.]
MESADALSILSAEGFVTPLGPTKPPARRQRDSVDDLFIRLRGGDRGALSRAITLVESAKESDQELASELLDRALPVSGKSVRVGITGSPGVGKSTLIDALGSYVVGRKAHLAVLTVDPSSPSTRGSILGDKSRMATLSAHPNAYIRPSPSGGHLGGVAHQTREAMLLCEAAGFDVIFVETVGVGQSEIDVRDMVDCFLLLALAGAGDELQGIKRGIMEMADVIALTKVDGDNRTRAEVAAGQLERALMLLPADPLGRRASVNLVSAVERKGIGDLWGQIEKYVDEDKAKGRFEWRRGTQAVTWMEDMVHRALIGAWLRRPEVQSATEALSAEVRSGEKTPRRAAIELFAIARSAWL